MAIEIWLAFVAASAVLLGTAGSILTVWVWLTVLP